MRGGFRIKALANIEPVAVVVIVAREEAQEAAQAVATTCQAQVDACETAVLTTRGNNPQCQSLLSCCQFLGTCNGPSFFACLTAPAQN